MKVTREQWMIGTAISGVVNATNAANCSVDGSPEAVNADPHYISNVAAVIAKTSSRMQVESAIAVLNATLERFK